MALKFYGKGRAEQILGIQHLPSPCCPKTRRGLCMLSRLPFFSTLQSENYYDNLLARTVWIMWWAFLFCFVFCFLHGLCGEKKKHLTKWIEEFSWAVSFLCVYFFSYFFPSSENYYYYYHHYYYFIVQQVSCLALATL